MVPADEKRRWLLARLLDIPPMYFGLQALDMSPLGQINTKLARFLTHERNIDVAEYRATLAEYCTSWSWLSGNIGEAVLDINRRIASLCRNLFSRDGAEKKEKLRLLCEYQILLAEIAKFNLLFNSAIDILSDAISVTKENKFYDIQAYALRQRGMAHLDKGWFAARLVNFVVSQQDFASAVRDLDEAKSLRSYLSAQRCGLVLLGAATAYAHVARDDKELKDVLNLMDEGSKYIGKDKGNSTIPAKLDQERYLLSKGDACISSPYEKARQPSNARNLLEQATKVSTPDLKTRQADNAIFQAQSYFFEGNYVMATAYTESAIEAVKGLNASQYMFHLETLYRALRTSPYGKDAEVGHLGAELIKVQRADLFN